MLPSISAASGGRDRPRTARTMARWLACRIFMTSISSTLADPSETSADSAINTDSRSRARALRRLESFSPGGIYRGSSTTAAATTGPAQGPRPTSSIPAMRRRPRSISTCSKEKSGPVMARHTPPVHGRKVRVRASLPDVAFDMPPAADCAQRNAVKKKPGHKARVSSTGRFARHNPGVRREPVSIDQASPRIWSNIDRNKTL